MCLHKAQNVGPASWLGAPFAPLPKSLESVDPPANRYLTKHEHGAEREQNGAPEGV